MAVSTTPLGVTTIRGRTMRAIDFLNHASWMSIGRTQPWPDESAPPPESPETLRLDTVLGYVRAQEVAIVIPSATGSVEFLQRTYAKLSPSEALKEGARQVYLRFQFGTELGVGGTYRQVGVQQNLLAAPGMAEHDVLLPPEVVFGGVLIFYGNLVARSQLANVLQQIEVIINL